MISPAGAAVCFRIVIQTATTGTAVPVPVACVLALDQLLWHAAIRYPPPNMQVIRSPACRFDMSEGLKFGWAAKSYVRSSPHSAWAGLIIYNVPNGISRVEQTADGGWKVCVSAVSALRAVRH
jgi:hypothetical protein